MVMLPRILVRVMRMKLHSSLFLAVMTISFLLATACSSSEGDTTSSPDSGSDSEQTVYQWDQAPPLTIDSTKSYTATLETEVGEIIIALEANKAPVTVNNFVFLAREGYYDNTTFHRVIPDFMAQGGDRTGSGTGGSGYTIADEFHPDLRHDSAGILSMANKGSPETGGSQFFITLAATPWLDGFNPDGTAKNCGASGVSCHSVFGRVTKGMDVLAQIRVRDPGTDPNAGTRLLSVSITEE